MNTKLKKLVLMALTLASITTIHGTALAINSYDTKKPSSIHINANSFDKEFKKTSPEIILKMKEYSKNKNLQNNLQHKLPNRSPSSKMASLLRTAGFTNSAALLSYSMKSLREEPLQITQFEPLASDIWIYSPEFKEKVTSFLKEARFRGSHEYFRSTSMSFNMPNAGYSTILANKKLKKRADLFGALHKVNLDLGIVKENGRWNLLARVSDRYDFAKTKYNGLVNMVNAIAYHDQELNRIKPYNLEVYLDHTDCLLLFGVSPW